MTQKKELPLPESVKKRLEIYIKKDVSILRQVIFKEVQEWRRKLYEPMEGLNVEGEVRKMIALSDEDKRFIDDQIVWFIFGDIPDDIYKVYLTATWKDLNRQPFAELTKPQQELYNSLKKVIVGTGMEVEMEKEEGKAKLQKALSAHSGTEDVPF